MTSHEVKSVHLEGWKGEDGDGDELGREKKGKKNKSYLSSSVLDLLDQRSTIGITVLENVAGDLDEVRVELALVPLGEDVSQLIGGESKSIL